MSNDERNPKSRNPWSAICCLGFSEFLVKPTNAGPDREEQKCVRKNRHKHLPPRRATPNRGSIDLPFPSQNPLGNCFSLATTLGPGRTQEVDSMDPGRRPGAVRKPQCLPEL